MAKELQKVATVTGVKFATGSLGAEVFYSLVDVDVYVDAETIAQTLADDAIRRKSRRATRVRGGLVAVAYNPREAR